MSGIQKSFPDPGLSHRHDDGFGGFCAAPRAARWTSPRSTGAPEFRIPRPDGYGPRNRRPGRQAHSSRTTRPSIAQTFHPACRAEGARHARRHGADHGGTDRPDRSHRRRLAQARPASAGRPSCIWTTTAAVRSIRSSSALHQRRQPGDERRAVVQQTGPGVRQGLVIYGPRPTSSSTARHAGWRRRRHRGGAMQDIAQEGARTASAQLKKGRTSCCSRVASHSPTSIAVDAFAIFMFILWFWLLINAARATCSAAMTYPAWAR